MEYIENLYKKLTKLQLVLIVVVAALFYTLYFFGLHPSKKLAEMRNARRRTDVANILNAVYQYGVDNKGNLPAGITQNPQMICRSKASSCDGMIDISQVISNAKYSLSAVPLDPNEKNPNASGYQIAKLSNGRLNVSAPSAENNASIILSK